MNLLLRTCVALPVLLWAGSSVASAQSPSPSPNRVAEMMKETFPNPDQAASPRPTPAAAPVASAPSPTPSAEMLAPMPAGMPTPMPSPVVSPVAPVQPSQIPGLDPQLEGQIEAGIPDPMQMTFPTVPTIAEPQPEKGPNPVTTIKLPPASSLELALAPGELLEVEGGGAGVIGIRARPL